MKPIPLSLALAIAAIGGPTWAAQQDPHQSHHPATVQPAAAPTAAPATAPNPMPGKASADMTRMDAQMKMMREMHLKMMAGKTPEERSAMMSEHMKVMQDGMTMMKGMSSGGDGRNETRYGSEPSNDGEAHGNDGSHDADDDGSLTGHPGKVMDTARRKQS